MGKQRLRTKLMAAEPGIVFLLILSIGTLWFATAGIMWAMLEGFKQGIGQGLLCWLVPFYAWYFAFTRYTPASEDREIMILMVVLTQIVYMVSTVALFLTGGAGLLTGFYQLTWYFLVPALPGTAIVGVIINLTRGSRSVT